MRFGVNFKKLREHQNILQQELRITHQLLQHLEDLRQKEVATLGEESPLCREHRRFAKELEERIRHRRALLENITKTLWEANRELQDTTSDALGLLQHNAD